MGGGPGSTLQFDENIYTCGEFKYNDCGQILFVGQARFSYASYSSTGDCTVPHDGGDGGCDSSPYFADESKGQCGDDG